MPAHVVIGYSVPIFNQGELLSGKLHSEILGYQNFKVSIRRNVPLINIQEAVYVPPNYFLTEQPSVSPNPPKVGLYEVVTKSTNFSKTAENMVLERLSGSTEGIR